MTRTTFEELVRIGIMGELHDFSINGDLSIPDGALAIVLFAHGSGSGRHSQRNQFVAKVLNDFGLATLLVDLLTAQEKEIDDKTHYLRFNIELLAKRIIRATLWLQEQERTRNLALGYFGSSTGAAAALVAASEVNNVKAIVARGGRPDLVRSRNIYESVKSPTLLMVGANDTAIIGLNKAVLNQLVNAKAKELVIIPGATHLFEEQGKMELVAKAATDWFACHLINNGLEFKSSYIANQNNKISSKISRFYSGLLQRRSIQLKFKDRNAAGEVLASLVRDRIRSIFKNERRDVIVIGVARGGAVVAEIIAKKLGVDFDITFARKLRSPYNPEDGIGAIMPDGTTYLNEPLISALKVSKDYIEMEKLEQSKQLKNSLASYGFIPDGRNIKNKIAVLVDDGIASGATDIVAARWIKKQQPAYVIMAAPVVNPKSKEILRKEVDALEIIYAPSNFRTVSQFYTDFDQDLEGLLVYMIKERKLGLGESESA